MLNALSIGVQGIQAGMQRLDTAAQRVAAGSTGVPGEPGDLATQLVEQKLASQQVSSSVEIIETADDMIGSLLNITA